MRELSNSKTCVQCQEDFVYFPQDIWFDDKGYGYSTKLCRCPYCGQINILKHIEDYSIKILNRDRREY